MEGVSSDDHACRHNAEIRSGLGPLLRAQSEGVGCGRQARHQRRQEQDGVVHVQGSAIQEQGSAVQETAGGCQEITVPQDHVAATPRGRSTCRRGGAGAGPRKVSIDEHPRALLRGLKLRAACRQFGEHFADDLQTANPGPGAGTVQRRLFRSQRQRRPRVLEVGHRVVSRRSRHRESRRAAAALRRRRT